MLMAPNTSPYLSLFSPRYACVPNVRLAQVPKVKVNIWDRCGKMKFNFKDKFYIYPLLSYVDCFLKMDRYPIFYYVFL